MRKGMMFCPKCEYHYEHTLVFVEKISPMTLKRFIISILTLGFSECKYKKYYWKYSNCQRVFEKKS